VHPDRAEPVELRDRDAPLLKRHRGRQPAGQHDPPGLDVLATGGQRVGEPHQRRGRVSHDRATGGGVDRAAAPEDTAENAEVDQRLRREPPGADEHAAEEARLQCLDRCLAEELSPEESQLLLEYYQGTARVPRGRSALAEVQGLTSTTLRKRLSIAEFAQLGHVVVEAPGRSQEVFEKFLQEKGIRLKVLLRESPNAWAAYEAAVA